MSASGSRTNAKGLQSTARWSVASVPMQWSSGRGQANTREQAQINREIAAAEREMAEDGSEQEAARSRARRESEEQADDLGRAGRAQEHRPADAQELRRAVDADTSFRGAPTSPD